MTANVAVTYTDVEPTFGKLYLPGEPAPFDRCQCPLCDYLIQDEPDYATGGPARRTSPATGQHAGIVDLPNSGMVGEQVHLRCLVDAAERGECEVTIGKFPTRSVGRHGAS